ncbi:MAG TPA: Bax inhibitor-1/YccA family protein [Haloplasmataceae bacterium]
MEFQSKNPVLTKIDSSVEYNYSYATGKTASFTGIATKTGILLGIILAISAIIWTNLATLAPYLITFIVIGSISGFISVLVTSFSRSGSPVFTIIYAISEGLVLGSVSAILQEVLPGIVANAIILTFIIFGFLLVTYATGIFKVGFKFRKIFITALFCILIFSFISFILSLTGLPIFIVSDPGLMIVISIIMVIMASFSLLVDFDDCRQAVDRGLPSRYEWYLSLGLLVSLIWLYTEIVRLLLILARNKD